MVSPLPLPDLSHAYVDQANRPSKDFYNWLKSLRDSVSSMTSGGISGIDWISVKSSPFNAQGDGSSNDTAAFNDCHAFCAANNFGMYIPAGEYLVDALLWDQGVNVLGAGSIKSILRPSLDTITAIEIIGVLPDRRDRIVEIGHFSIQGSDAANTNTGFHFNKVNNFHFRDLATRNINLGFWIEGGQYCIFDYISASSSATQTLCGVRLTDDTISAGGGGNNMIFNNLNIHNMNGVGVMVGRTGLPFPMGTNVFINPVVQVCAISSMYFLDQVCTTVIGAHPEGNATSSNPSISIFGETVTKSTIQCVGSNLTMPGFEGSDGPSVPFLVQNGSAVDFVAANGAPFVVDSTSTVTFSGTYGNGAGLTNVLLDLADPVSVVDAASLGSNTPAYMVLDQSFPNAFPIDPVAPDPVAFNCASTAFGNDVDMGIVATATFNASPGDSVTNRVAYLAADAAFPIAAVIYISFLVNPSITGLFGFTAAQTTLQYDTVPLQANTWTRILMKNLNTSGVTRSNRMEIWPGDSNGATIKACRFVTLVNPSAYQARVLSREHRFNPRNKNGFQSLNSAIPTFGTWLKGDIVYNNNVATGGFIGWVCTVAGTPGTWKTWGPVS